MKRIVSFVAVLIALALASTASAQVQTGSILVKATRRTERQRAGRNGHDYQLGAPRRVDERRHRCGRCLPVPVASSRARIK